MAKHRNRLNKTRERSVVDYEKQRELEQFKTVADKLKGKKYMPDSGGHKVTKSAYNKMAAEIAKRLEKVTKTKIKRNRQTKKRSKK